MVLSLILSIIFSSLPVKVWACGLSLCPMEHQDNKSSEAESETDMSAAMPCHQNTNTPDVQVAKSKIKNKIKTQMECPCPETFLKVSYIPETRAYIGLVQLKSVSANQLNSTSFRMAEFLAVFYRPPPPRLKGLRQHVVQQVFII